MATVFAVGDLLPPLSHTVTPFQLFRYSAVTWNPHRIHFDAQHAREEGHAGLAAHSHLRAALALRAVTEGLGPGWRIATVAYRLRRPLYAPVELTYTARVVAVEDDSVTLELIEENPSGEVGFEGTVSANKADIVRSARPLVGHRSDDMSAAVDQAQRPVRIGNCSGFYGDRASAMADMTSAGGIDVLTGDYLAEVTMLILGKARAKDPSKGYAASFLHHLDAAIESLVANRIRLVVNAGGLNPVGLATATRELAARRGHELRVAHIDGDDVFDRLDALPRAGHALRHLTSGEPLSSWPHRPLTANAYLGGFGIARALEHGADIVITGRVADASLVVGAAAWWWGWTASDHDALAGAVCAGHVIECGAQATGGNFSGFLNVADLDAPGFPIAEIAADGSSVITKHAGTGGAVTEDTVKAQLLYEIGEPAYLNPDVVAHLNTAEVSDLGDDRVDIRGVRGSAPPPTTKVAITAVGGWQNSMLLALTGCDVDAKAALMERSVRHYVASVEGIDAIAVQRIGQAQNDPDTQNAGTELLRIAVHGTEAAAGRMFSSRLVELALSSYPGLYALDPPHPGSAFGVYWPALLDQTALDHTVHHHDGTTEVIQTTPVAYTASAEPVPATPTAPPAWTDELVEVALSEIVHARSGDKGGDANVGVWVRDRHSWAWLESTLTVDEFRRLLPETRELPVERYELPNLGAANFVIRGLLGAGATSSLRLDAQAKALGEWLRARTIKVPRVLVEPPHSGEGL